MIRFGPLKRTQSFLNQTKWENSAARAYSIVFCRVNIRLKVCNCADDTTVFHCYSDLDTIIKQLEEDYYVIVKCDGKMVF